MAALLLPALLASPARADELLVMPYSCSMAGGQPVLTPGPEQSHRILGQRERRRHKACSPVNPSMCRQWTVHRFDIDCDGRRVSWVSVAAATSEGSRRAWLLDGRLLLRMGPRWSLAPDDPCARGGAGPDERPVYGGQLRRECAQRLAMAPPPVVEMPFGYAPMLGIDGIFVTAKTPPAVAGEPPSKSASADAKTPLPPGPPRPEPLREPKAGDPKAKDAQLPAPAPQPAPKVASAPKAMPTSPAVEAPATKAEAGSKPPTPKVAAPPLPAKEGPHQGPRPATILPAPAGPEEKKAAPSQSKPAASRPASSDASAAQKVVVPPAPKIAERPAPPVKPVPPQPKAEPEGAFGSGLLSLFRTTTTGAIIAFAGLALGLLAAFTLARRREHARDVGRRRRDISALSLDGRHAKAAARAAADARRRPQRNPPASASPSAPPGAPPKPASRTPAAPPDLMGRLAMAEAPDWGDRMPRTREEALEVLGIGIAPSATATAIKKIVDGLRMSWHPDLAKDETDRALREQRSKQINAAWAILHSQSAEV
jgi:hypothetical protein